MRGSRQTARLPNSLRGQEADRLASLNPTAAHKRRHLPVMGCHLPRNSLRYLYHLGILDGVHHRKMLPVSSSAVDAHVWQGGSCRCGPGRRICASYPASRRRDDAPSRIALGLKSRSVLDDLSLWAAPVPSPFTPPCPSPRTPCCSSPSQLLFSRCLPWCSRRRTKPSTQLSLMIRPTTTAACPPQILLVRTALTASSSRVRVFPMRIHPYASSGLPRALRVG